MFSIFRGRNASRVTFALLALVLFAMVATGFGSQGMGGLGALAGGGSLPANTLASVGKDMVTPEDMKTAVDRELDQARQQQPGLDIAAFFRGGGYEGLLDQLITSKALAGFGEAQGLVASKVAVDREIVGIPAFQNLAGQFDEPTFRRLLAAQHLTEKQVRDDISSTMIRQQLLSPAMLSPRVPRAMAVQYASLLLEQRAGSIGFVPAAAMATNVAPTDADVAAFYRANQARYMLPEQRVLRYALFGAEEVAAAARPTDAEIETAYKAAADKYAAHDTRTLSQVVLPSEAAAKAVAAKAAGGAAFASAAGANLISVGAQTKMGFANIASPQVADAVFAAAKGATIGPIRSPLGWHVVHVDSVTATAATPLAAVRDELEKQIAAQKQGDALNAMASRIEDKISGGSNFEEVAKAEKLTILETPPLTSDARSVTGAVVPAEAAAMIKDGFGMEPDDDPVVEIIAPNARYAMMAVARVVPSAPPPLAEVADRVRADLAVRRAAERARAVASAILAKVNAGTAMGQAFAEAGMKLPPVQAVQARRIDIAKGGQQVPPPLAMMFSMAKGKARLVRSPDGAGWYVVSLAQIVPGNVANAPGVVEATRSQFASILSEEYASQFARAVQAGMKVKRNDAAIARDKQDQLRGRSAE